MSFGEELKRERQLREISLREVSEATKISLRYLEALERNDLRNLPGGVFNRGFVRAYSQFIGVDPESMVDAYMLEERTHHGAATVGKAGARGNPARGRRLMWIWIVLGVLVASAAGWYGWNTYKARVAQPGAATPADADGETGP